LDSEVNVNKNSPIKGAGFGIQDPGSRKNSSQIRIQDPGGKKAPDPGSTTLGSSGSLYLLVIALVMVLKQWRLGLRQLNFLKVIVQCCDVDLDGF
jgi:hypothetical protein